jgi:aconitate hydratase
MLRKAKVVGKFVEFYGPGAVSLPVTDRATIGNMAPEYGATMGFFPIDEHTVAYLRETGRPEEHCRAYENYYKAQGLWGIPNKGEVDYSQELELDLGDVVPAVSGPLRPQDRVELTALKEQFRSLFTKAAPDGGYGKNAAELPTRYKVHINGETGTSDPGLFSTDAKSDEKHMAEGAPQNVLEMVANRPTQNPHEDEDTAYQNADIKIGHGSVLIAAITSCTNTSNPSVMLAAGLLAKKAVEKELRVDPSVKTSLGPGSRVVSDYLDKTGLQPYLDKLGFQVVGFGCTTCIGNSGPLHPKIEEVIHEHDLVAASVL